MNWAEAGKSGRLRAICGGVMATLGWACATALLTLLVAIAAPRLLGGQSYAVLSGSMAGSVETGDLVIVMPHRASEIEVGEIVAFADPEGSGRTLQHRVQRVSREAGQVEVVTMGDANTAYERWRVSERSSVGRVSLVVSKAGYVFGPIAKPIVRGLLTGTAWLALLGFCLLLIWRHPKRAVSGAERA